MKKTIVLVLKVLFIATLFINEAFAQACSENTNVNGIGGTGFSNGSIGQSFTACQSGRLTNVAVQSGNASVGFNNVVVEIFNGDGYGGTRLILTGQVHVGANRTTTWDLTSYNVQVIEGQKYTARFNTYSGSPMMAYGTNTNAAIDFYPRGRIYGAAQAHNDMFFSARIDVLNSTITPLDQATEVSRKAQPQIQFSRSMVALTGDVTINNIGAATSETVPVTDLVIDGGLVTIPNATILEPNTQYEILIPAGALKSTDEIPFKGFVSGDWNFTTTADRVPTISSTANEITNITPIPFSIDFSESVTGFDISDLTITNGTASNFAGSGTSYTVDITPLAEGIVKVETLASVTVEGNESGQDSLEYDITNPTVTIISSSSGTTSRSPIEVTIQFSEPITGFDADFLDLTNAEMGSSEALNDSTFTAMINASNEGVLTVDVPASIVLDLAGNSNDASAQFSIDYQIDLNEGLISFYPLNTLKFDVNRKNADLIDQLGTPALVSDHHGQSDGAYNFSSGILYQSAFNNAPIENGFSISTWIKPTSEMGVISAKRVIYEHANSSTLYYSSNALRLDLNGTADQYVHPVVLPANTWTHLLVSVAVGGNVYLYIDNIQYDLGVAPASLTETISALTLGASSNGSSVMNGDMDEIRYYGKALHPVEAFELYNQAEFLLLNNTLEICENDSFTTPEGDELSTDGNYFYIDPSGDSSPDTFVSLTLNTIPAPQVIAVADNLIVCDGNEVTLTGQGAVTYVWDNGVMDGVPFIPTATNTYTVTGTAANGCENTSQVTVQLVPRDFDDEVLTTTAPEFCPDGSPFSATISTAGSSVGVDYYLRNSIDDAVVDGPIVGTGSALDFNAGTLTGTTTFNVFAEQPSVSTNYALDFDGSNDKVATTYTLQNTSTLTFEGWILPRATIVNRILTNYAGSGAAIGGDIIIDTYDASANNGKALRIYATGPGNVVSVYSVPNVLTLHTWNHFAVTFDNGVVKMYVNGIQVGSSTMNFTSIPTASAPFYMGEDRGGTAAEFLNGQLDEVRIWNTARTASELAENKNICLAGTETGLDAYYNFDDGMGTETTDLVSSNNGTLTNMDPATDWVSSSANVSCLDYFSCSYQMSQEITIGDQTAPVVVAQDVEVQLDKTGFIVLDAASFNSGSSDNCTISEDLILELDQTLFSCDDVGVHTVTLTATDAAGNQSSTTASVTILSPLNDQAVTIADETLCSSDLQGTIVTIDGSQLGIEYYLRNSADDSILDGPITGTGGALDFATGQLSESTTFNVYAETTPLGDNALDFDGSDDYLSASVNPSFDYGNGYTLEAWVNSPLTTGSKHHPIFHFGNTTYSDIEVYLQNGSNRLIVLNNRRSGVASNYKEYPTPPVNTWYHLSVTYDGTNLNAYYNGVLQTPISANNGSALTKTGDAQLTIGYIINSTGWANAQRNFIGKLDEIRMWDSPKTGSDIQALMNSCVVGNESGLMTYYNFDKGDGASVPDLAGGLEATLVNMDLESDYVDGSSGLNCTRYQCSIELSTEVSITVEQDEIAPVAIAQDITIELDATGAATIVAEDVNNGSSDNCTELEDLLISIDQTQFDETMIGENVVTLSVEDGSGNTATATAVVRVTSEIEDRAVTTASNTICPDADAIITLSNSQLGLNYTLRDESNATVLGPILGTGLDIDFNVGILAEAKTFNVLAETRQAVESAFNQGGIGYVSVPSSSSLRLASDWTIEAWVNPAGASLHIVETYDGNGGFALRTNGSGVLQAFAMFSSSTFSTVSGSIVLPIDQWSHVAATFNETTDELKVYVNGVLDNTNSAATIDQRGSQIPIKLGARGDDSRVGTRHIQDEIRIWNIERTAQEINDYKSINLNGNETGLVAYYDYNEVTISGSSTIEDKSSNSNNGVTVGNYFQSNMVDGPLPSQPDNYGIQMSTTQMITPEDATPPTVITQDLSLILDTNGDASITIEDIDNGSSDNCTAVANLTFSLDKTTFDINDLGPNTVTLTVNDANGNSNSATATVNISDKQEQVITFDAISDKTFGDSDFSIAASTDSSLPIVFSVVEGNVTITNNEIVSITGAGSATIRASQAGDDTYAPALVDRTFNVAKADQFLTVDPITEKTIASPDIEVVASVDTEFALDYSVSGPATISGNTVSLNGTVGTVIVTVSQAGTDNYNSVTADLSFEVVDLIDQVVTFSGVEDKTFGDSDFEIVGTADSNLPISFSVVSGNVTLVETSANSATISIVGAGAAVIRVSNVGDEIYAPYEEDLVINVSKANQVITIEEVSTKSVAADPITINASVDTEFALDYSVSGPATNSGNVVTLDGTVGTVIVTVSQAGTDNYNQVSATISFEVVAKQTQSITFTDIPDVTYGVADQTLSATSTSGLEVSFSLISGPALLTGSTLEIAGAGEIVVEASQTGDEDFLAVSVQQTINVNSASLSITADNQTITWGEAFPDLTFSYSGFVNGENFENLISEPTISTDANANSDAGTYSITLEGGEASNYTITLIDGIFLVNKKNQVITFEQIADKEPTDASFDVVASVDSELDLVYAVSGPATILGATITLDGSEGIVTVTVSQAGDVNHNEAMASITFEVVVILALKDGLSNAIKIYPNPVSEYVMIDSEELVNVRFFGLNGQLLREINQVNGKLDVSNLKIGTYLMEVSNQEEKITVRIHKAN
jgi:hypothetical protein